MSNRVTQSQLDSMVKRLNIITGSPLEPYTRDEAGRNKANIGNYHLSGAYGGVALHRMFNESGGVSDVFNWGHMPKRELYSMLNAYIRGIESTNE